jgi:hypothetical protein
LEGVRGSKEGGGCSGGYIGELALLAADFREEAGDPGEAGH